MLEQFLPGMSPKNKTQEDVKYAFKLWGVNRFGDSIFDRMFKTKKQELEERLLERQLVLLGDNPDTQSFNAAVASGIKIAGMTPQLANEIQPNKKIVKPLTLSEVLKSVGHNVDFRIPMTQHRAAYLKRIAKGIAKAV